jgi:hypothetical protein
MASDTLHGRPATEEAIMSMPAGIERRAMMAGVQVERMFDLFDQNQAMRHGWCLNQYGDGMVGIVKDDDSDTFSSSDEAHQHVALSSVMSLDGDYRHLCAQAVVIETASIAARDLLAQDGED